MDSPTSPQNEIVVEAARWLAVQAEPPRAAVPELKSGSVSVPSRRARPSRSPAACELTGRRRYETAQIAKPGEAPLFQSYLRRNRV